MLDWSSDVKNVGRRRKKLRWDTDVRINGWGSKLERNSDFKGKVGGGGQSGI